MAPEMKQAFTIGVDYGTNSVRAVVVDCADGRVLGTSVFDYPSGDQGVILDPRDPHLARQNPATTCSASTRRSPAPSRRPRASRASRARASSASAWTRPARRPSRWTRTASRSGSTRACTDELAAYAWLWKDHTAAEEAAAITETARRHAPEYLAPIGGTYSSEWFWSKIWRCLKVAPEVFDAAASWVELADYIPAVLAGIKDPKAVVRCVCAAGHKAMYSDDWGGLPSKAFLARLDPKLAELRDRLYDKAWPADRPAGHLVKAWADTLGLPEGIPIAMGGFDAHYGAVGAGVRTGTLVKIIGTSTCDCAIAPTATPAPCPASAASSTARSCRATTASRPASRPWATSSAGGSSACARGATQLHAELSAEAARLAPGASGLVALDWNNGNRTILVDPKLTGLIVGQTLHTTRAEIYRALIEATAFGARAIVERMVEYGVPVERVVCCGGIAEKNDLFMQIYADVLGQPMLVAGSPQTPALGAAISAAVAAGAAAGGYATFEAAQAKMTALKDTRFEPDARAHAVYDELYGLYRELHDAFGGVAGARADLGTLMKRLLAIRERATGRAG